MSSFGTSSPVSASTLAFDAVAGLPVELIERDLLGFRGGRVQRDGTGDERKAQEAFPVRARGHERGTPKNEGGSDSRRTADHGSDTLHPFPRRYFWVSAF